MVQHGLQQRLVCGLPPQLNEFTGGISQSTQWCPAGLCYWEIESPPPCSMQSPTGNWSSASARIKNGVHVTFTSGSDTVTGVGTLFGHKLIVGDVLLLQASPTHCQGYRAIHYLRSYHPPSCLRPIRAPRPVVPMGETYVPNSISDVVTIGNSNNAGASTITLDMTCVCEYPKPEYRCCRACRAQTLTHSGTNQLTVLSNVVSINQQPPQRMCGISMPVQQPLAGPLRLARVLTAPHKYGANQYYNR